PTRRVEIQLLLEARRQRCCSRGAPVLAFSRANSVVRNRKIAQRVGILTNDAVVFDLLEASRAFDRKQLDERRDPDLSHVQIRTCKRLDLDCGFTKRQTIALPEELAAPL